jgi:hypothetical protein
VGLIPESLDANVDSLLHSWHVQYFSKVDEYCHDDAENVYFPDSVYEERLERLPSVIRLPYNEVVRDCIDLYAGRKRDLVRYMLGMADFYFPIIRNITLSFLVQQDIFHPVANIMFSKQQAIIFRQSCRKCRLQIFLVKEIAVQLHQWRLTFMVVLLATSHTEKDG